MSFYILERDYSLPLYYLHCLILCIKKGSIPRDGDFLPCLFTYVLSMWVTPSHVWGCMYLYQWGRFFAIYICVHWPLHESVHSIYGSIIFDYQFYQIRLIYLWYSHDHKIWCKIRPLSNNAWRKRANPTWTFSMKQSLKYRGVSVSIASIYHFTILSVTLYPYVPYRWKYQLYWLVPTYIGLIEYRLKSWY